MHDNIGQLLSVVNLQLNILGNHLPTEFDTEVNEIKEVIYNTVQEVRSLSKVLNNDVILKNGLIKTLQVEIDRLNRLGYMDAFLEVEGNPISINNASEIIIFRIVQESLSNVLKHAKASKLFILLEYKQESFNIKITDNGIGFDLNKTSSGSGMETIKNRAALIKASLIIDSELGKGTQLFLKYFYRNDK